MKDHDGNDSDERDDNEVDPDPDRMSCRSMWVSGRSYFAGVQRGYFVMNMGEVSTTSAPEKFRYADGDCIIHDGIEIGKIVKRLGQGNYGTVYSLQRPNGRGICAVKAIREDASEADRIRMEKELAIEVSIGFALGKSALVASVISMVVPLPGVKSTAKGLLLLCDLVDGGDLEEAMHKKPESEDYNGLLYTDEGMAQWPLASITLQIFTAFAHIHSRGVIHQVRNLFGLTCLGIKCKLD